MPPLVSILIPTHNRSAILRRTLESLREMAVPPEVSAEVIVVANACTDDTLAVVESMAPSMPFATRAIEESTVGLNPARNRAIREASGEILAFLDDDIWADKAWLAEIAATFERTGADILAGKVTLWWEAVERPAWMDTRSEHLLSCVDYGNEAIELKQPGLAVGANIAFRRRVPEKIGTFTAWLDRAGTLPLAGGDTDFLARALEAGFRMFYAPAAAVKHWVAPRRITLEYLSGVAYGAGLARAYLRRDFTTGRALRSILLHAFRASVYTATYAVGRMLGAKRWYIHHRIRQMTSRGNVTGAYRRWRNRTPTGEKAG